MAIVDLNQIYNDGINKLTNDITRWKDFLTFSSQLHKYSFLEKVQIFEQYPTATYLASFDQWKLIDRAVTRNQRGIAITKLHEDGVKREFLFDLSQTYGKDFVEPNFDLSKREKHEVISMFYHDTFGEEEELVPFAFEEIISKGVTSFIQRDPSGIVKENQIFIENSILFSLSSRVKWLSEYSTFLDDLDYSFSAAEIDLIGKVTSEVTKHALIRVTKLKEIVQNQEIKEEKKNERGNYETRGNSNSRSENKHQSGTRRSVDELRENGDGLSTRTQSDARSNNDGRRNSDDLSTQKRGLGNESGNNDLSGNEKEQSTSGNNKRTAGRKTQSNATISGKRDSNRPVDQESTNKSDGSTERSFQQLDGNLPYNNNFSFRWYGSEKPLLNLTNDFKRISKDYPEVLGHSDVYEIVEVPSMRKQIAIKSGRIETPNIETLYQKFKLLSEGKSDRVFEKELYEATKKVPISTRGRTMHDEDVQWYQSYLKYLNGTTFFDGDYDLIMTPSTANPYLSVGVAIITEDHTAILQMKNEFHKNEYSLWFNEKQDSTDDNQGLINISHWMITEQQEQESLFEFDELRRITVRNVDEFKKMVETLDGEVTEFSLYLEYELLRRSKDQMAHKPGVLLNDYELKIMNEHLKNLNPFDNEGQRNDISLEGDPYVVPLFSGEWKDFEEGEGPVEDDGAMYLDTDQGVKPGQIEVRDVGVGRKMYRYVNISGNSIGESITPDEETAEIQVPPVENPDDETRIDHSWNILEDDEYLRVINGQYYLYVDNGSYCIEVESNQAAAAYSLYRDTEPRKVDKYEEYGEWQKLDESTARLKHTNDPSYQQRFIGVFDHTINQLLVETAAIKIKGNQLFWRPENNQPDRYKVKENQLVHSQGSAEVIPRKKLGFDKFYIYYAGQSSLEVFIKNGIHVMSINNTEEDERAKFLNGDPAANLKDAELYLLDDKVQLYGKLDGDWSYSEVIKIIEKNVEEIIERKVSYKSLFGLPIVDRPESEKKLDGDSEIFGVEQSLFDFDEADSVSKTPDIKNPSQERISNPELVVKKDKDTKSGENYFPESFTSYEPGKRQKAKDNLAALKLLNELSISKRTITDLDQEILAKYSGWGGIPEIFEEKNPSWSKEHAELKTLLSEKEFSQIRSTVLTAFYTDPKMIETMYKAVLRIGDFSKGNILDPAMGTGNFYQALPKKLQAANLKGIEIDPRSFQIAKALYPDAELHCKGFEEVNLNEKMDLIIGNFPFNNIKVLDKKYDKYSFVVHDYFMAKSIDSLELNGVLMFITSTGTMDKKDSRAREYLAKRARLVGGVRLPKTAFKQSAGTEVISDILIFQKKTYVEMVDDEPDPSWLNSVEHPDHEGLIINQYFLDHPDHILGSIQTKNFHGTTIDVFPNESSELTDQLQDVFDKILSTTAVKEIKVKPKAKVEKSIEEIEIDVPEDVDKYSFFMIDDRVFYHTIDGKYEEFKAKSIKEKVKYMLPVKAAVHDLLELQKYPYAENELEAHLKTLNNAYDTFVRKCGHFNDTSNMRALREDLKFPLLLSLEKETDEGYQKQPIFYQATVRPIDTVVEASNAKDALRYSMTRKRRVDFSYINEIYPGHTEKEVIEELDGVIFINPKYTHDLSKGPYDYLDAWEISEEYLTGNVKSKLEYARIARKRAEHADLIEYLDKNIAALEEAQPEPLLAGDIKFQLGSPWVPVEVYNEFMYTLFETPAYNRASNRTNDYATKIDFLPHNATWKIARKAQSSGGVLSNQKYGTDRINGYQILEATLNLQQVTVKDPVEDEEGKTRYVINPEETMIAKGKQADIENEFQKWLFSKPERTKKLVDIYNDQFNVVVPRTYRGDDFFFDGMNIDMELRQHQKDVVARIVFDGRALMAHEVGAGKTAAMAAAGMYLKRNNLIHKALYVVPNHLTEAWGKEILTFYPSANILITTKKDFEKKNRQEFVSKIATGDYDAIVIGQSQFERIPLSKERQQQVIEVQIDEVTRIVHDLKEANSENWTIKQMERFQANLEGTLKRLDKEEKRDEVITFEDLGVDFLFVDEAHIYKNLFTYTKMQNVAGVGTSRSQRASDMLGKVRYIQEEHNGKNVVFATGTPISNSMSEMYVMQYFLQPETLKERRLTSFDAWAATFGQVTSSLEITPEGAGYRIRNRFSKFHNLPELMKMFYEVADIQTADMLELPVPALENGKVETVITKRTSFQKEKMNEFVTRSEAIRNGLVDPRNDNMLKLTNEAKLMAIDSRLLDESLPRDPESKLSVCAEKTFNIWEKTKDNRSTQIIFSDSGTPKSKKFNVYDEIKDQLTEKGIPAEEIAFIHDAKTDAQRDTMFERVRNGDIRIILGSTSKLGTGTNIQNKLIHAHHIDCPWKPSDLTQREGRILRQGNENPIVGITRYVTKGTFDSYLWQIQEQKLTYISQVMNGNNINRSMDDLDDTVLTAAEVKAVATDNPLLAKKMSVDNDVSRLKIIKSQFENSRDRMDRNVREIYPEKIAHYEANLKNYQEDLSIVIANKTDDFKVEIRGKEYHDRTQAFEEMNDLMILEDDGKSSKIISIGSYRGLEVQIQCSPYADAHLVLKGQKEYRTTFNPNAGSGNIIRLQNLPNHISSLEKEAREIIEDTNTQLEIAKREVEQTFPKQEELDQLLKEQQELNSEIELETMKKESGADSKKETEASDEVNEEEMGM
ncbi:helicase-related protein [Enterococcus hulanensis]|uniref:helicase-related protein n=1 Tax=Enterococcus hulanensis TaxID=2559929 RepID=UPI00201797B3|nr:helicase-related protein [Enterococcus hulanensis]